MEWSKSEANAKTRRIAEGAREERLAKRRDLIEAIENLNVRRAHELVLECGVEGMLSLYPSRLLNRAIETDNEELVKDLLGMEPGLGTESGRSLLWEAVLSGATKVAGMLVRGGADLAERHNYSTFLHALASSRERSRHELAILMLERGADPRLRDALGNGPLHCAVRGESPRLLRKLLEMGAGLRAKNKYNENALALAACRPEAGQLLAALLGHDGTTERCRRRAVGDAIRSLMRRQNADLNAIRLLGTSAGFDIATCNTDGNSLVVEAILAGAKQQTIELLLELGSDLTIYNQSAWTWRHRSAGISLEKVKFFIKRSVVRTYRLKTRRDANKARLKDRYLKRFYKKCLTEARYMKSIMMSERLPMLKILTMSVKSLSWAMRNTSLIGIYEKNRNQTLISCPTYFVDLETGFESAKKRHRILAKIEEAFTEKLQCLFPALVIDRIFFHAYMSHIIEDCTL